VIAERSSTLFSIPNNLDPFKAAATGKETWKSIHHTQYSIGKKLKQKSSHVVVEQ